MRKGITPMQPIDNDKSPVDDTLASAVERVQAGVDDRAALNKVVFGDDQPTDTLEGMQAFLAQRAEEDFPEGFEL